MAIVRVEGDADTGGDDQLVFTEAVGERQRLQQFAGERRRIVRIVTVRAEHDEFITADPADGIATAHRLSQPLSDFVQ